MTKNKSSYNYIEDYMIVVRSKGRFSVTQNELLKKFNISPKALNQKNSSRLCLGVYRKV